MKTTTGGLNAFVERNREELYRVHRELCVIPAPSHHEDARAEYCKAYLESVGASGVYIDDAKNVVFPYHCEGSDRITVFSAHTDIVFPAETPLNFTDDGEILRCPGVGDDTACLSVLLLSVKYLLEQKYVPDGGILFVCNSCEEGLGNLKGTRQIFRDYAGRIRQFVAVDAELDEIFDRCVGSHRYEVTVSVEGGHSFSDFGRPNAIAEASKIITAIYSLTVPKAGESKTTYNVGTITGGTTVNSIAQHATFLCEYRSDNVRCIREMEQKFRAIFASAVTDGVSVNVVQVGERPCEDGVDRTKITEMTARASEILTRVVGKPIRTLCASTDCNIPLSLGVPAICVGAMISGGTHTTEEWLDKKSMLKGFLALPQIIVRLTED